jgi:hypothetical protein
MSDPKAAYIKAHKKSRLASLLLTVLLGPLGLFYTGWVAALILLVLAIASFGSVIGPALCWLFSVAWGQIAVGKHNTQLTTTVDLMHSGSGQAAQPGEYTTPDTYTPPQGPAGTKGELAGTFAGDRPEIIKSFCMPGDDVILQRDPNNPHDANAIAACITVGGELEQIGFIKAAAAKRLAPKMDAGTEYAAYVHRVWAPEDFGKPNVTIAWYPLA